MIEVAPDATIRGWLNANGVAGLVGVVKAGIQDSNGDYLPAYMPSTTGIVESDTAGIYVVTRAGIAAVGNYALVWSEVPGYPPVAEDLLITTDAPGPLVGGGRPEMQNLIYRLRVAIGDASGADQHFLDTDLQAYLDANVLTLWDEPLTGLLSGQTYLRFFSDYEWWDSNVVVLNANLQVLTPATSDVQRGVWTFATQPVMPVYARGNSFDLYGAAADACDAWAAALAQSSDFSADGQLFSLSQRATALRASAVDFKAKARPQTVALDGDDRGFMPITESDPRWRRGSKWDF